MALTIKDEETERLATEVAQLAPTGPLDGGHRRFHEVGKGRHPAALHFGGCLTYAVARVAAEPLLCVGDDFTRTDLELVDW